MSYQLSAPESASLGTHHLSLGEAENRHELVFIDSMVQDRDLLLSGIASTSEVIVLDGERDGIGQVSVALAERRDLDAVHFVTHGSERLVRLGSAWLSPETLAGSAEQIAGWSVALAEDADILFYACNLASEEEGQGFLASLQALTGADIAASSNDTGHAQYGADWDLEFQLGGIETAALLSQSVQDAWSGLLVTVTVTNTSTTVNGNTGSIALLIANQGGDGISLGEAILAANNTGGLDTIAFNISGGGVKTIQYVAGALPSITSPVILDGTTQPGYAGSPLIQVSGVGNVEFILGVRVTAGGAGSTIRGLALLDGLHLQGGGNHTIQGNYIGLTAAGASAGWTSAGVLIESNSSPNLIGGTTTNAGNVISGNGVGIQITGVGANLNFIQGNYIGTNTAGTAAIGNRVAGIRILSGTANVIGGSTAGARNVISGNGNALDPEFNRGVGIILEGAGVSGNAIRGNYIGTNAAGTAALGNAKSGVGIYSSAFSNTVGGTSAGEGNLISGNGTHGVDIAFSANSNTVQGNYIGTNAAGTGALGNNAAGVLLNISAATNTIGGTTAAARNVIAGNENGVLIANNSTGNLIQGNYIGVGVNGTTALGNDLAGVFLDGGSNNTIGGTGAGAGNRIAFNGTDGVQLRSSAGNGNPITGNLIFSNGGLGIDLNDNGVTSNDALDGDSGPNGLQNYPVLTSAVASGGQVTITGSLNSVANTSFRIEFFVSPTADPTGFGEGQTFLGFVDVTTNGSGNATFNPSLAASGIVGQFLSATATRSNNDTSEFSQNIVVSAPLPPVLDLDANNSSGQSGANYAATWTEDGGAVPVADPVDATLTDGDSTNLQSLTVTLTNRPDGAAEALAANTAGTSITASPYNSGSGVLLLSGSAPVAQYQQVLRTVTYNNTSQAPTTTARSITFVASDGVNSSSTATTTLTVVAVNDAPVNQVPGAQTTNEEQARVFSSGNGNLISIADVDAGAGTVQVTLTGTNGTITVPTVPSGGTRTGNGTATVALTGAVSAINTAMNGLSVQPTANFNGTATLQIVTNDQSNSGAGGAKSDTDQVTITVNAVNDPPSFTKGLDQQVNEDAGAQTVANWATNILAGPANESGQTLTFLIQGNTNPGLFSAGPVISSTGTLTYTPAANANGSATLTVALRDSGGMANGGQDASANQTFTITVSAVDDPPVITSNGGGTTASISVPENTTAVTTLTSTDVDGGAPVYSLAGGADVARFTINASTGVLTFLTALDFEAPADADTNNIYQVTVQVSDGAGGLDTQALSVTVTDVSNALTVTTTSDAADGITTSIEALNANRGADGQISLREAILAANQTANDVAQNIIGFNITGTGVRTIQPIVALPTITGPVIIDGTTQPGYAGLPLIELNGSNAGVGVNGLLITAGGSATVLRGLVINRFTGSGVQIEGGGGHLLEGNFIGTNAAGTAAAPNGLDGLTIVDSAGNLIGGVTPAARNLMSGNAQNGIDVSGSQAFANQILGNFIGTDVTGMVGLPNGANGIALNGAAGTAIGSIVPGGGNRIAFNGGTGIAIPDGLGNRIEGNAILGNGGLGIDLGLAGVTANDATDLDAGANQLQNVPVLTSAWLDGTVVTGTLNSLPTQTFALDFFANAVGNPTGFGEGARWLGRGVVMTDLNGTATFQFNLETPVALGELITATAMDAMGNTSEFSAAVPVTADGVAMYALSVFTNGTGRGNVSTLPAGINLANGDPSELYPKNTLVTLRATPEPGFEFAGWSGFGVFETSPTLTVPVYEGRRYAATFVPAGSGEKVPPTVRAVQVKSHWAKSLTVTWDRLIPPTGFVVSAYRISLDSESGALVRTGQTSAQKTSFTFTGLDPVRYRVTVSAILARENNPDQTFETGGTPFILLAPIAGLEGWRVRNEGTAPSPPRILSRSDWSNVDVDPRFAAYASQYDYGQFSAIGTPTDPGLPQRGTFLQSIGGIAQNRRDYELTLQVSSIADGAVGVMIRSVDPNNYYRFSMERDPNHDGDVSDAYIRLIKMHNGQPSVLLQDDGTPAELRGSGAAYVTGSPYFVTIEATAPSILVTVTDADGLPLVDWRVMDSTFTGNGLALYSSENPGSLYSLAALGRENPDPDLLDVDLYVTGAGQGRIFSTVNGEPGSLGTDSPAASITRNTIVTLTAEPLPGYDFGGWFSRSLDGQARSLLTMGPVVTLPPLAEDLIVEAVFTGTPPPSHSLDINGDQQITAETDGRLALRFLAGAPDSQLNPGSLAPQAVPSERTSAAAIRSYIATAGLTMMDVDGDGVLNPFTDGRLIYRFLQQLDLDQQGPDADAALLQGAVGPEAQRTTAAEIRQYLSQFVPGLSMQTSRATEVLSADSSLVARHSAPASESSVISEQSSVSNLAPTTSGVERETSNGTEPSAMSSRLSASESSSLVTGYSSLASESSVISDQSSVSNPEPRTSDLAPPADSPLTIPLSFAGSFSVQSAALADDTDSTPLTAASNPWLSDFIVSSVAAEDPNRDLLVTI